MPTLQRRGPDIRAVYVTPSHQYPLGTTMSASRRFALLDWAARHEAWILEDDYDSEFRYISRPVGALQGMDARDRVIYMGTFSKALFPALRVGYVVVPPSLWSRFLQSRFAGLGFEIDIVPTPQAANTHFIARLRGDGSKRPILLATEARGTCGHSWATLRVLGDAIQG